MTSTNRINPLDYDNNTTIHTSDLMLKENKSRCKIENSHKVALNKIIVDGGLIAISQQDKCDYIVHWQDSTVLYIELKGGDIYKAFSQVESTIMLTKAKFAQFKNKQCVIVCSRMRIPKNDTTMMKLKRSMKALTGSVPIISSQQHNYIVKP